MFTSHKIHGLEPGCDGVFPSLWGGGLTVDWTTLTVVRFSPNHMHQAALYYLWLLMGVLGCGQVAYQHQ